MCILHLSLQQHQPLWGPVRRPVFVMCVHVVLVHADRVLLWAAYAQANILMVALGTDLMARCMTRPPMHDAQRVQNLMPNGPLSASAGICEPQLCVLGRSPSPLQQLLWLAQACPRLSAVMCVAVKQRRTGAPALCWGRVLQSY